MDRTILHCDCNSFFASVECKLNPALLKVPMAVSGNPESRHGIILAKNELAKKYKVTTAETVWQAKKKCPDLVLVPPHYEEYVACSRQVNAIYGQYTDLTEPFGIDETFLDVTGSMHLFKKDGEGIALELRRRVKKEVGITISVGVSFNKVFAKLGSDYKKPDATTIISRENFSEFLYSLPVCELLFVGPAVEKKLYSYGITTIGRLAQADRSFLVEQLGKMGGQLSDAARGLDDSPVVPEEERPEAKSVSHGMTFPRDLAGEEEIKIGLAVLADKVAERLRRYGLKCGGVQISVKDPGFNTISRQKKLACPTWLFSEIFGASWELIKQCWDMRKPIRLLSVGGIHIVGRGEGAEQLSLFGVENNKRARQEKLEQAVYTIRNRYGKGALLLASASASDLFPKKSGESPHTWDLGEYTPFHGVRDGK